MKKVLFAVLLTLPLCTCFSQIIDFEPVDPAPQFQDADVGAMAFGDIDNDGDQDLMITGKGGPIRSTLYENDGIGNFTEITGTPFTHVFDGTVGFEDLDNDGDLDLLITGSTSSPSRTAFLYLNDGSGNFALAPNTPFEANQNGDFDFGDMDNDGDTDIIITGYDVNDQGFTTLYTNNGSGVFTEVMNTPFEAVWSSSVAFIDIEKDNDLDVILAGENNNGSAVTALYTNNGSGTFTLVASTPFDPVSSGDIGVGDSDNDGDEDILLSGIGAAGAITKLYQNDGSGAFTLVSGTPFAGSSIGATLFADLDNDGDLDVFLVGNGAAIIAEIYENQGGNTFLLSDTLAGAYLSSAAIGDMDGDNDLDIVIGGTSFTLPARSTKTYENLTQITIGMEELENLPQTSIYPNPSTGSFQVESTDGAPFSIMVYTSTGQLVFDRENLSPTQQIHLDQPAGLYLAVITMNGQSQMHKLIITE